ncbi:MAG: hypothetical protein Tsb0021_04890 [Chlamydiales bacterium]
MGNKIPISDSTRESLLNPHTALTHTFKELQNLGGGVSGIVTLVEDLDGRRLAIKKCHGFSRLLEMFKGENSDSEGEETIEQKESARGLFDELGVSKVGLSEFNKSLTLNHPTIVKIYTLFLKVFNQEVTTNLLMEYIEGSELIRIKDGTLSREHALKALNHILSALIHLIERGIVPTDLHGGNIIVTQESCRMVDIEGHETLEEAEKGGSSDSNLEHRLKEVWGLVQDFIRKGIFSQQDKIIFYKYKSDFHSKESVKVHLNEVTNRKNIFILREFIEGFLQLTSNL